MKEIPVKPVESPHSTGAKHEEKVLSETNLQNDHNQAFPRCSSGQEMAEEQRSEAEPIKQGQEGR